MTPTEEMPALRERAIKALARRDLTARELVARLERYAGGEVCQEVVAALAAQGLQSDVRAAEARARQALARGVARARAKADLEAAGVAAGVAAVTVEEVYAGTDEREALAREASRLPAGATARERARWVRRMVSKGHDPEAIQALLGTGAEGPD
jgi:regulatory protein